MIGFTGSIEWPAPVTRHLPAYSRHGSLQTVGYLTDRQTGSDSTRDVFPLGQRQRSRRAPTSSRNDPTALRQQKPNRTTPLTKGTPNVMQRLACFPAAPHLHPLLSGKPVPFSLCHKHHL